MVKQKFEFKPYKIHKDAVLFIYVSLQIIAAKEFSSLIKIFENCAIVQSPKRLEGSRIIRHSLITIQLISGEIVPSEKLYAAFINFERQNLRRKS